MNKKCPDCDRNLVNFSSLRLRTCPACHKEFAWELKEGQRPLVDGSRAGKETLAKTPDRTTLMEGLLRECADELSYYIDHEFPYRNEYPHIMAKWDASMDIVRRITAVIGDRK